MANVRLPEKMEQQLTELCALTHRTKSFYIKEALSKYLEDMGDVYISLERISQPERTIISTEEILKHLQDV